MSDDGRGIAWEKIRERAESMGLAHETRADLEEAKTKFTAMLTAAHAELEGLWTKWDAAVDTDDAEAKKASIESMVALLNRRSYIRNLVRDVNEALE